MWKRILIDGIIWIGASLIVILWRVVAAKMVIVDYIALFAIMMMAWFVIGLVLQKYTRSYKEYWFWQEILISVLTGGVLMALCAWLIPQAPYDLSLTVALWTVGIVMIIDAVIILFKHYWKFALNMTVPVMKIKQRKNAKYKGSLEKRSKENIDAIHQAVLSITNEDDYKMLVNKAHINDKNAAVISDTDRFTLLQMTDYRYSTIVDMTILNNIRGINKRLCVVNQKLPDDGVYVCCYRPQEYVKEKMLASYPRGINYIVYGFWFIVRRVIPRLLLMSRLYYDLSKGRKRMLSKTEVLGRLYYCGFEVDEIVPMGHIEYVFAHRHSQPYPQEQVKIYGPLIKLPRVCKDKKIVYFYKTRTMHPYAEYIQNYVFDQRGGMNIADKSDDDWRITNWGRIMRKYWLDELPMLFNFIKGDVKLVGVRPLSKAMFDKYPPELQDKRTRCKPGLIPPFYIDHPDTFDELFASENKYLDEYFKHPIWTDTKYFFMTMWSIVTRKTHSA